MEFIRGWHNVRSSHRGCVLTIGNFDGVHRGHQALLQRLLAVSRQLNLPTQVITFEPQPNEYFQRTIKNARLMRLREKIKALDEVGVDRLLVGYFDEVFAQVSAEEFVLDYLVGRLGVKHIIVGDDFRFGYRRQGDINLLIELGRQHGFTAETMPTFELDGERVSSSLIRTILESGDLNRAEQLLGHRYSLSGRVAHGDKIGREMGFPTANIHLHRLITPVHGIFAVRVFGIGATPIDGAANVGSRPTVGGNKIILEVHLFDFNQDIYGQHVRVEFIKKLRDEEKFSTVEAMRVQIVEDVKFARVVLADVV